MWQGTPNREPWGLLHSGYPFKLFRYMNDKNKLSIGSNAKNLVKLFAFNSVQIEESFDRRTLDTISEGILEMGKDLEQLTREKIECLRTVINCKEYIFWLREELKGKWFFFWKTN